MSPEAENFTAYPSPPMKLCGGVGGRVGSIGPGVVGTPEDSAVPTTQTESFRSTLTSEALSYRPIVRSPVGPPPNVFDTSSFAPLASSFLTPLADPQLTEMPQPVGGAEVGTALPTAHTCPRLSTARLPFPCAVPISRDAAYWTAPLPSSFATNENAGVLEYAPGVGLKSVPSEPIT